MWLLLRDLTQFYSHAHHIDLDRGESFAPRFTLTAVHQDPELTMVEDATVRLAVCGFIVAGAAMVWALARSDVHSTGRLAGVTVLVGSTLVVGITLWHWAEGHIAARLVRR